MSPCIPVVGKILLKWMNRKAPPVPSKSDDAVARPINGSTSTSDRPDLEWWRKCGLPEPIQNAQFIAYRRSTHPLPKIMEYFLNNAEHDIWFVGANFPNTLTVRKQQIIKKLNDGIEMRFLIYNCCSSTTEDTAKRLGQEHNSFLQDCKTTVVNLWSVADQIKKIEQASRLKVKVSSIPTWRFYIFDKQHGSGMTFFVPYVFGENSPNLPGYLAPNTERGVLQAYFYGLERLWNAPGSEDFESWYFREYKPTYPDDNLKQDLPHVEDSTEIRFINGMQESVIVSWINREGNEESYKVLLPGENYVQQTYVSHRWVVRTASDKRQVYEASGTTTPQTIEIN